MTEQKIVEDIDVVIGEAEKEAAKGKAASFVAKAPFAFVPQPPPTSALNVLPESVGRTGSYRQHQRGFAEVLEELGIEDGAAFRR